ncbi:MULTISPECIES: NAD(P)/FAD-dependent oxidoreductase [Planktothrix]|uniref:NAD(P)/FAD-dependent oxidoreductase n=1 Tax=Planktothrix TaxID=54304 RepID=UPI00042A6993|nr:MULTISPECIES: NAD(P)/FAD-dependent oxidoreductase [Planktothrix]CAD5985116.1 Flavin-dependent halogenase armH1 [Planktothrix rubescens]CAH2575580.1 Flavin-dependent halogenase armH1 [Planktothrix rubescens]
MNIPQRCDVVIIGGGPAGSMAATFLSQKGYDVVLLERCKYPRHHIGENIIPQFWKYTDLAQVSDKIAAEGFIQKAGGTSFWNGLIRQIDFKDFGYSRQALHVERDRFDLILLENAQNKGVQVFEEVSVLSVDLQDGQQEPSLTYRLLKDKSSSKIACRFIVDASGQNAVIAKQLGIRTIDADFRFMSLWGYFKNSKYIGLDGKAHSVENLRTILPTTFICSFAETGNWGWSWHIPLRESTSVGLVLPLEFMKKVQLNGGSWESYFRQKCYEIPILEDLLANAQFCEGSFAKIQDYSYRSTQLAGPGFFLIGDAAGFIDPIFSLGIVLGMYSAYTATWAIDRSFKNPSSLVHNQALFSRQMQGRLEVARSLALPRYQLGHDTCDLARATVQMERSLEQELMAASSTMTGRSDNFQAIASSLNGRKINSNKFRVIEEMS